MQAVGAASAFASVLAFASESAMDSASAWGLAVRSLELLPVLLAAVAAANCWLRNCSAAFWGADPAFRMNSS